MNVSDVSMRMLRASYYAVAFGRDVPYGDELQQFIHQWELKQQKGDVPKGQALWEQQYRRNDWAYLSGLREAGRYAAIIAYLTHLKPRAAVLDVGCGEGILFERYRGHGYTSYVGLDISADAVASLQAQDTPARSSCRPTPTCIGRSAPSTS